MKQRHNQILAGILVVQIALSVVVFWPRSVTVASEPLFPDMSGDDIVALTITDNQDNSIQLEKGDEGWLLPDADDYPVDVEKITPLLDNISGLSTDRLVTRTDASHRQLQVSADNFVRRLEFETADGATHTLYLGSSPRYGATHFRLEGQDETYLTSDISVWDVGATASSWIDTVYLSVSEEDVTAMSIENANGTFTFTKEDGEWAMEGLAADETLNGSKVTSLALRAGSLNMTKPLGKEEQASYGMDEPGAVVTLETAEKTITLEIGAQDPDDNSYVVTSSESPYYVRVAEFSAQEFVEATRDTFLQLPPTPTPTPASE